MLWLSEPSEPPTAYIIESMTSTPSLFLGAFIEEQLCHWFFIGLYLQRKYHYMKSQLSNKQVEEIFNYEYLFNQNVMYRIDRFTHWLIISISYDKSMWFVLVIGKKHRVIWQVCQGYHHPCLKSSITKLSKHDKSVQYHQLWLDKFLTVQSWK